MNYFFFKSNEWMVMQVIAESVGKVCYTKVYQYVSGIIY